MALSDAPDIPIPVPKNLALSDAAQPPEALTSNFTGPIRQFALDTYDEIDDGRQRVGQDSLSDALAYTSERGVPEGYVSIDAELAGFSSSLDGGETLLERMQTALDWAASLVGPPPRVYVPASKVVGATDRVVTVGATGLRIPNGLCLSGGWEPETEFGVTSKLIVQGSGGLFRYNGTDMHAVKIHNIAFEGTSSTDLFEQSNASGPQIQLSEITGCSAKGFRSVMHAVVWGCQVHFDFVNTGQAFPQFKLWGSDNYFQCLGRSYYDNGPSGVAGTFGWQFVDMKKTTVGPMFLTPSIGGGILVENAVGLKFDGTIVEAGVLPTEGIAILLTGGLTTWDNLWMKNAMHGSGVPEWHLGAVQVGGGHHTFKNLQYGEVAGEGGMPSLPHTYNHVFQDGGHVEYIGAPLAWNMAAGGLSRKWLHQRTGGTVSYPHAGSGILSTTAGSASNPTDFDTALHSSGHKAFNGCTATFVDSAGAAFQAMRWAGTWRRVAMS
jgi:hypothetical protein